MARSLEGSREPARLSEFHQRDAIDASGGPFYKKSWGMYDDGGPAANAEVQIELMEPNLISAVAMHSFVFEEAVNTSLRIIAPLGYQWVENLDTFYVTMDCNYSAGLCHSAASQDGIGLPTFDPSAPNELVWDRVLFLPDVSYGFEHLALLPWHSPRTSSNAFFFEVGFLESDIKGRLTAVAIEAPRVVTTTTTTTSSTTVSTTTSTTSQTTTTSRTSTTTTTTTMPRQPVCAAQFLNATTGWAVRGSKIEEGPGEGGMLLKTFNSGAEWFRETSGDPRFSGMHFVDTINGWAVGQGGTIWRTRNGGTTWDAQLSGTDVNLLGVHFVTEGRGERRQEGRSGRQQEQQVLVGWAVGERGAVLKYTAQGQWVAELSGTSHSLVDAFFVDTEHGWVVGDQGTILETVNGGTNWTQQLSGTTEYLYRVRFDTAMAGWVLGGFGTMLRTVDGGASWNLWS